jgi:hypothetical protein
MAQLNRKSIVEPGGIGKIDVVVSDKLCIVRWSGISKRPYTLQGLKSIGAVASMAIVVLHGIA